MSSNGKKKTTMAKLNREARLRERKELKRVRKNARQAAAADSPYEPIAVMHGAPNYLEDDPKPGKTDDASDTESRP